jgi:hypothetical protein
MIYSMSNSVIASGKMAEWQKISEAELVPLFPKLGMKLVGSWHAYSGDVNSTYTLFSWDNMAAMEKAREANQKNKAYQRVSAELDNIRSNQFRILLDPIREITPIPPPNKVYIWSIIDVIPGKFAEFEAGSKEMTPVIEKVGMKTVGAWRGYTGNVNQRHVLYAYKDMAEYQKIREARAKDAAFVKGSDRMRVLQIAQTMMILEPNAFSPMK